MAAEPKTQQIETLLVTSTPLPPFRALDLVPELAGLLDGAVGANDDVQMFVGLARALGGGKLRDLLPRVMAGTKVKHDKLPAAVTLDTVEAIDLAFDGHMRAFIGTVAFALEVSFRDFFEGGAQTVKKLRAPSR